MFNFRKKRDATHGRMAIRDRFVDIRNMVKNETPVIIDGGANEGCMTELFLSQYKNPEIHAFEPIPELVDVLRSKFGNNKRVSIYQNALGAVRKKISFNVINNMVSSSVFTPTSIKRSYHGDRVNVKQVIDVEQIRLDDIIDKEIDILKFDLQGYELEAFKGCGRLLEMTKIITTEIAFVPLYEEQPLFGDIDVSLRKKGFRLLNLYELWTHPDGQLTAGDAVYLNSKYF